MALRIVSGVMPCSRLYSSCNSRRRRAFRSIARLHRVGYSVGIQNHFGVHISSGTADGLHERCFTPQETFLIGIQDGHERNFRQVETFAQQVYAHEHVELAFAQVLQ